MRTGGKWPHISDTGAVRAQDEVILQKPKQIFEEDRLAGSVSWHAVGRSVGKRRGGLWVGKMETSECGMGMAGSRAVTALGQDLVQFGHEHKNSFKNRSGKRT